MVAKGRRGDVPGQVRFRGGAAARRVEVPRALLEEGGEAAEKFLAKGLSRGPESCGSGWAPPHQASTWAMRSNARFRAGSC
ncbi:hypothetical protein [uncultured Ellagibacter sp.]|uniref:hypothetical protein n=1 Tax=uncultured Ellagibacter sp. TaxID=2137580 RepID=UPI0026311B26|nr:hypothetical protein [uncultured Ellagibacter sp.]